MLQRHFKEMDKITKKKIGLAISVIIFGVLFRIFLVKVVGIPNFEAITALSLVSGSFLGGVFAPIVPLTIVFLSDIYFGNILVYLFTWTAFILVGIFGVFFKKNSKYYFLKITGGGVLSVLFFYLWTNFGWWLTTEMYEMTIQGLIKCYIAGLPFLKNQLFSVLIFAPAFSLIFSLVSDKLLSGEKFVKRAEKTEQNRPRKLYENFTYLS